MPQELLKPVSGFASLNIDWLAPRIPSLQSPKRLLALTGALSLSFVLSERAARSGFVVFGAEELVAITRGGSGLTFEFAKPGGSLSRPYQPYTPWY